VYSAAVREPSSLRRINLLQDCCTAWSDPGHRNRKAAALAATAI